MSSRFGGMIDPGSVAATDQQVERANSNSMINYRYLQDTASSETRMREYAEQRAQHSTETSPVDKLKRSIPAPKYVRSPSTQLTAIRQISPGKIGRSGLKIAGHNKPDNYPMTQRDGRRDVDVNGVLSSPNEDYHDDRPTTNEDEPAESPQVDLHINGADISEKKLR